MPTVLSVPARYRNTFTIFEDPSQSTATSIKRQIEPLLKAAIITLRCCTYTPKYSFLKIAKEVNLDEKLCEKIFNTVKARVHGEGSDNKYDLYELLIHCLPLDRPGRPIAVLDRSLESATIRNLLLDNPYLTWQEVIDKENIPYL